MFTISINGSAVTLDGIASFTNHRESSSRTADFLTKGQTLCTTGWYYYGYRWYNVVDGRWLSRDPIREAGGINLYAYVGNNLLNLLDPLGLAPHDPNVCCDAHTIAQGKSFLQSQAALIKAGLASGGLQREGEEKSSCKIDHDILMKKIIVPKCWECRKECGYSPGDYTRLFTSPTMWRWKDHCVVICKAHDETGKPTDEIVLSCSTQNRTVL